MAPLPQPSYGEYGNHADLPTDEEREEEVDEDAPVSQDWIDIMGFDPDELDWDDVEEPETTEEEDA
jgi:hypothetical protein